LISGSIKIYSKIVIYLLIAIWIFLNQTNSNWDVNTIIFDSMLVVRNGSEIFIIQQLLHIFTRQQTSAIY